MMLADERGVDTFPMRLVCYATLTAAIAWLVLSGLQNAGESRANDELLLEMEELFMRLDGIYGGDAAPMYSALPSPGASVLATLHLPADTRYIAFGTDPEADGYDPGGEMCWSAARTAYLSTDSLGLRSWALGHHVRFGSLLCVDGQLLPPVEPVVIEGGGEVVLRFTMAFDLLRKEYWVLVELVQGL